MRKTLLEYKTEIMKLPLKKSYTKEELLTPKFLIEEEGPIQIYYAPHNEYQNKKASIFIIGITPGFQQMSTAIAAARKGLELGKPLAEIQYDCKEAARFSGAMRKNIVSMLDELELNKVLSIDSTEELFGERDELLHTISLIPYSVFVKGANYSGHTPKLLKTPFLMKYVYEIFVEEYNMLENKENMLLIPLGRAVEEVLLTLEEEGKIHKGQILRDFPHPSGANVNRLVQLRENKAQMMSFLKEWGRLTLKE